MMLVKYLTRVLEFSAKVKLDRAQKRSDNAMKHFSGAKSRMTRSNQELQMTQAEILIQLNKLGQVGKDVVNQQKLNSRKIAAIEAVINTDFSIDE